MLKAAGADERRGAGGSIRDRFEVGDLGSLGGLGGYREGLGVCSGAWSRSVVHGQHMGITQRLVGNAGLQSLPPMH